MFKTALLVLSVVLLQGCSSLNAVTGVASLAAMGYSAMKVKTALTKEGSAPAAPAAAASSPATALVATNKTDLETAALAQTAKMMVSLRTKSLADRPATVAALKQLCKRGIQSEVVVSGDSPEDSKPVNNTCVSAYVSKSPSMTNSQDVLLVDIRKMYSQGSPTLATVAVAQQEYDSRLELKRQALRSN